MRIEQEELVNIIDELAGAAVSMNQGAQSYDCFIKARERCLSKIQIHFSYSNNIREAITELQKLV